jgi:hypothetical protein
MVDLRSLVLALLLSASLWFIIVMVAAASPLERVAARGMAMAKSGVKPLIFLIAVSVMAWVAGMAIHGF